MTAIHFLLRRYFFPNETSLLRAAFWVSVTAIAIGIAQLIIVISVMSGFHSMLKKYYTRITSELIVVPQQEQIASPEFTKTLKNIEEVKFISPIQLGQAMLIKEGVAGVMLEGIDFESSKKITPWDELWVEKPVKASPGTPGIWVGVQLAKKLNLKLKDKVHILILTPEGKKTFPFEVTAITKFGIYDHDMRYARIDLKVLQKLFHLEHVEPLYKVSTAEDVNLKVLSKKLRKALPNISVKKWSDINQNIFLAVEHQKKSLFFILEILIALAAVNVINLIFMNAYNKKKDLAILRAMGMRRRQLFIFFLIQGSLVGIIGITFGLAFGILFCKLAEIFQPHLLNEFIYNTAVLPFEVQLQDILILATASFLICTIMSMIPAYRASRANLVTSLKND
jgi:ABC-type lipoprotein release transport system permease subunit